MTLTRSRGALIYYGIVAGLSAAAFLVFFFTIGGGRLSGPGLFLALAVLTLGVVARLLYLAARALAQAEEDPAAQERATGRRRKELEREYQALKRALKEIELDHAMGKLSDGDYGEIRGRYRERAVRVLRQLDQGESYKKQIELDLKARREALAARPGGSKAEGQGNNKAAAKAEGPEAGKAEVAPAAAQPPADEAPEPPLPAVSAEAPRPARASGPGGRSCPDCSARNDGDAAFCKKCGLRLAAAPAEKD